MRSLLFFSLFDSLDSSSGSTFSFFQGPLTLFTVVSFQMSWAVNANDEGREEGQQKSSFIYILPI